MRSYACISLEVIFSEGECWTGAISMRPVNYYKYYERETWVCNPLMYLLYKTALWGPRKSDSGEVWWFLLFDWILETKRGRFWWWRIKWTSNGIWSILSTIQQVNKSKSWFLSNQMWCLCSCYSCIVQSTCFNMTIVEQQPNWCEDGFSGPFTRP